MTPIEATLSTYLSTLQKRLQAGISREHSYRGDLEKLLRELTKGVEITNEPAHVTDCGNPDYILTKANIPIGYIETKDLGKDLNAKIYQEQFERYKKALDNLIITDYIWFQFFQNGELVQQVRIAELRNEELIALPQNFDIFYNLLENFCTFSGQNIKSSHQLAALMASKARLLQNILERAITADQTNQEESSLLAQYDTFKTILIHDLTPPTFADIYAQTLAYGLFAARLHDTELGTFSRQKAADLIPKSNPFLRKLFGYIAGLEIDERIVPTVDNLAAVFRATDLEKLLKNFGKNTQTHDPIIHFYENFLSEYDPKLRKSRGVWYTPEPIVNFIIRAIDDILKTEFHLPKGIADTSKIALQSADKNTIKEVHQVQILDPATGTGTFLAETIKYIHNTYFTNIKGIWSDYVERDLIPRLHGFELLMASYAMAHLKLEMLLKETDYQATEPKRLRIYLTNALEAHHAEKKTLFSSWLSQEANEASRIKRDAPVMVVLGNPPYAVSSSNKSAWIQDLVADYKKNLNERKINLDDDYIKFIRYGQYFIDKNGSGVLAYISNNSFIDGITHRQMRKHLLESFDTIYILDLHGNAKRKETAPDGSLDQNVFDIMQGVSINIFIKTGKKEKNELAQVFYTEAYGKRETKFSFLSKNSLNSIVWEKLSYTEPNYFFVPKNFKEIHTYNSFFDTNELFVKNVSGVESVRDAITIHFNKENLLEVLHDFKHLSQIEIEKKYQTTDARDWKILRAKTDVIENHKNDNYITKIAYRLFDFRYTFYTGTQNGFVCNGRYNTMRHLLSENVALVLPRLCKGQGGFQHGMVSKYIVDRAFGDAYSGAGTNVFPLYTYLEKKKKLRKKNFSKEKELLILKYKLEQAQAHFTKVKKFFDKKVQPFYEKIDNPTTIHQSLFEENRNFYEEAQAAVESLRTQIQFLEQNDTETNQENIKEKPTTLMAEVERVPNLNKNIIQKIEENLNLKFENEKTGRVNTFAPIDILDYIYAILYSKKYRKKYQEFLKIDFPRIPYPKEANLFWELVGLGSHLRQLHLLELSDNETQLAHYPIQGDNLISRKITKVDWESTTSQIGKIWINDKQYFENIPIKAWEFYIGGYQPAQKWLKDRRNLRLSSEEISHYQKIIKVLVETETLMEKIDEIIEKLFT
ncbi:type ISP restriction/modification enzyme [Hugenholtzia roseola]|uniref:type ISP restriction/modification enzyme n=1 Tax=Hugenholtzia roseola TaxID=1002 RepID=UPI0004146842|nr:type ISP restriction/modification enzyme [Hugenholtzia roseola]